MEIEILHALDGDKKKTIDTNTVEGRVEAQRFLKKLLKEGTAIFLERGKKTYRVVDYDGKKDRLTVSVEKKGKALKVGASPAKGRQTAVPPRAGG